MSYTSSAYIPSPGSPVAVMQGCACPVGDNMDGQGAVPGHFWVDSECQLHRDIYAREGTPAAPEEQHQP